MGGYVSREQLERARGYDVLDYILTCEAGDFKRVGSGWRMKEHPSVEIKSGKWHWYSKGLYGKTALDYLTDVRGYGLVDAVCMLLNEAPASRSDRPAPSARAPTKSVKQSTKPKLPTQLSRTALTSEPDKADSSASPSLIFSPLGKPRGVAEDRKSLTLPLRNGDNNRIIEYLQSRGIDKQVILDCIKGGSLYENAVYHNCVFVGRDESGKARFAALRGTKGDFKCDAEGSDKRYGFMLPPTDPSSHEVAIFESPIDCLSHQTLCKQGDISAFDGWRLSLGGTALVALTHFLDRHGEVKNCVVCTDNDEAGNKAAAGIAELPGITVTRSPPAHGKDWNDTLKSIRNEVKPLEDKRMSIRFITSDC